MKRIFLLLITLLLAASPLSAAFGEVGAQEDNELTIQENIFVFQLSRMENDPDAYVGKTVTIEGLFGTFHYGDEDDLQTYRMVYRYYPGDCCAADIIGLEVYWPRELCQYPEDGAWVRAKGTLETYELDGYTYLQARLSSLVPLEEEGASFVTE